MSAATHEDEDEEDRTCGVCQPCKDGCAGGAMACPQCATRVCECCEVQMCDAGYHGCPVCGASLGSCVSAVREELVS